MARLLVVAVCLLFAVTAAWARETSSTADPAARLDHPPDEVWVSTSTLRDAMAREAAGPDTFDLYGGAQNVVRDPDGIPGSGDEYVEGRFEDPTGTFPRGLSPDPGDWTGVDATERPVYWNVDTFNAENLNANGAGNRAMWCGLRADDPRTAGWTDAPGYGNNWEDLLLFEQPVSDPSVGQTVDLDFVFNIDTEEVYDFFYVEFDSAGQWITVLMTDGTNADGGVFQAPGIRYADVRSRPIVYAGGDYGADDTIRIRMRFSSDGAYSDEDGLFVSQGGAVQIDDVTITTSEGTLDEDFEGAGPYLFDPFKRPFFGDFANVFRFNGDLDPCVENRSPVLNFVDRGQDLPNGPANDGTTNTGGTSLPDGEYATPEGWVVNFDGGLAGPGSELVLTNEVWSPEIAWDLPGTEDDDPSIVGVRFDFDLYADLPPFFGIYWNWNVRSFVDGAWDGWERFGSGVGSGGNPRWVRVEFDVSELVPPGVEKIQVRFMLRDYSEVFGFPSDTATPGAWFDNVRVSKYRVTGPKLYVARGGDLANDAFSASGLTDASTLVARDALDVRFDLSNPILGSDAVGDVPGDSVVLRVQSLLPGRSIQDKTMHWVLLQNPFFEEEIRTPPSRPGIDVDFQSTVALDGRVVWSGTVAMQNSTLDDFVYDDVFFADLPDEDFLYPGDVLQYYFEVTDDGGGVSTMPADVSGFGVWDADRRSAYRDAFTMRALPTLEAPGQQPDLLVVSLDGHEFTPDLFAALERTGRLEGSDWDSYTLNNGFPEVGSALGFAGRDVPGLGERRGHGANVDQLAGYNTILYVAEDGGGQLTVDADLDLLEAWQARPGRRSTIHVGPRLVSRILEDTVDASAYVQSRMGVGFVSDDVSAVLAGDTSPRVAGVVAPFDEVFLAQTVCGVPTVADQVAALAGASMIYAYVDAAGVPVPGLAAGVLREFMDSGFARVDITLPLSVSSIVDDLARSTSLSARERLLDTLLDYAGSPSGSIPTDAPGRRAVSMNVAPTPFNPKTTVTFALDRVGAPATVRVYDVRGQLVRTLHDGPAATADLRLTWDGRDDRGANVGSGVYFVRATTVGFDQARKAMLVK